MIYRRTTQLVGRAQRFGKRHGHGPRATTAHAVRKADSTRHSTAQQTRTSCAHRIVRRASLDLLVKSYCASSVLSSGAYRVAARLL